MNKNDDERIAIRSSFGCHVAVGNVAPGFRVEEISGAGEGIPSARLRLFPFVAVVREPWWMVVVSFAW